MTRAQHVLARRWRPVLLVCVLVALSGAVVVIWARIDREAGRAEQLAAEADRRGDAVTTLAGDVRVLRAQIKAKGGTPKVPDPKKAVRDLPDRTRVPCRSQALEGRAVHPGSLAGPAARDAPEKTAGPGHRARGGRTAPRARRDSRASRARTGRRARTARRVRPASAARPGLPACPDGYSLQAPAWDPDALVCRRDGAPQPDPSGPAPQSAALERKRW
ncbi:collagen-like protein [Streptomyces albus subsp. chlorinus]|uniref:collagen-like protein n=1 Tax=Streptomyces albus TaxID=1888 RepID=UPI001FAB9417|nr:collagen-like protein [Streptomyces albus]